MLPRTLWKLWFTANFLVSLLLLYPLFWLFLSHERFYPTAFQLMRVWARWLCYVSGIFPLVTRKVAKQDIPAPCVYVANHSSYLDIPVSYLVVPRYFIFVGKQELDKAPLFRIFFKGMNILVNRKSNVDSHRAFLKAAERIEQGESIFIFPEATISPAGKIIPFKNGAFKLAIDKQVPIVPLVYVNNWKHLQNGGFLTANGMPGFPKLFLLPPVSTKGLTNEDLLPLRDRVKKLMEDFLESQS